ncbi:KTSC domain-containing protein, partial [Rahnella victoriana]|uniref:KTSC domain-containing protein n=1 Tax=Rahnella victoriana TaxID=1510570 RepID=UPI001038E035
MQRVNVVSSNILSIGYDPNTDTLEIEFLNGGIYEYYNVSQDIHIELMNLSRQTIFSDCNFYSLL